MEDTGRVRRGYFVEGLGGAQFGLPGAIDRLRSERTAGPLVLAATDPANPYGAALMWPDREGPRRAARRAGSHVIVVDGDLIAYVERGGRHAITFGEPDPDVVAGALADLSRRHRRRPSLETIDDVPAAPGRYGVALAAAGFSTGYRGLTLRQSGSGRA